MKLKNLNINDRLYELNPVGIEMFCVVCDEPYFKDGEWFVTVTTRIGQGYVYRQLHTGDIYNNAELKTQLVYEKDWEEKNQC